MTSQLLPVAIAAGVLSVIAVGLGVVSAMAKRRYKDITIAWKKYAADNQMTFLPPSGWHHLTPEGGRAPTIEGEVQGVAVIVTVQMTNKRPMTRVEATLPNVSSDFLFAIYRRSSMDKALSEAKDVEETRTGNKVFDAEFALYSSGPDLARSILNRRLAHVVGAFPREFKYLYADQNRFSLIWEGMETDPAMLSAAIEIVYTACRRRA